MSGRGVCHPLGCGTPLSCFLQLPLDASVGAGSFSVHVVVVLVLSQGSQVCPSGYKGVVAVLEFIPGQDHVILHMQSKKQSRHTSQSETWEALGPRPDIMSWPIIYRTSWLATYFTDRDSSGCSS